MSWDDHWSSLSSATLAEEATLGQDYGDTLKAELICALLNPRCPPSLLEVGCGTARTSLLVAKALAGTLTAVDTSLRALQHVTQIARHLSIPRVTPILADARSLPLPSDHFSLTWSAGLLEHFTSAEQARIIREMLRVTAPGGTLLLVVPNILCLRWSGKYYLYSLLDRLGTSFSWPYGKERMLTPWGLRATVDHATGLRSSVRGLCLSPLPFFHPDHTYKYRLMRDGSHRPVRPWLTRLHRTAERRLPLLRDWFGKNLVATVRVPPLATSEPPIQHTPSP